MTLSFDEAMAMLKGGLVTKVVKELNEINLKGVKESATLIAFLIAYLSEVTGEQTKDSQEAVIELAAMLVPEIRSRAVRIDPPKKATDIQ